MCYELVGMFFASNPEAYSLDMTIKSHIPDMTFSAVVSGMAGGFKDTHFEAKTSRSELFLDRFGTFRRYFGATKP